MFRGTVLALTLSILVCVTKSQILQNHQPWTYANFEQVPRIELARQNPIFFQPTPLKTSVQSAPLSAKCTASCNENQQSFWDKFVTNSFDTNPNNYEKIIRYYDSIINPPNYVNNYYVAQPEQPKRTDKNCNKNWQNKKNKNNGKAKQTMQPKAQHVRNDNEKGKKQLKNKRSKQHKRKKKDNKPLGDHTFHYTVKKDQNVNMDSSLEIEEIEKSLLNDERSNGATTGDNICCNNKNSKDLNEKGKTLYFDKIETKEEKYKHNKEERNTKNHKTLPTIEYPMEYFNQKEFNQYFSSFMTGNISNPYYYSNDIYPYLIESFYKTAHDHQNTKTKNKNTNRRKNAKKPNRKENNEETYDTVIELSPTFQQEEPVTITTGTGHKKDIYLNLKFKTKDLSPNFDFDSNTPDNINKVHFQLDRDEDISRKHFNLNMFIPTEDDVEYYPDFTLLNHAYITSSEEEELDQIKKHRDYYESDKYHYTDRVKSYVLQSNKKSLMNPYTGFDLDLVTPSSKNQKPFSDDINMNVETIFAPSRVVNYSQIEQQTHNNEEKEDNFWFKEGDTTIILSRPID